MFICTTKTGKTFTEGEKITLPDGKESIFTWDNLPDDIQITALQLLWPFPVKFKKPDGTPAGEVTPKLTIKSFNRYYFFNEATAAMTMQGDKIKDVGKAELQAKTIAGIDDKAKIVLELRMDKWGNVTMNKFPRKQLEITIKKGLFRKEIIRNGIQ